MMGECTFARRIVVDDLSLWGLFVSAFVSATLFPGGSEAVLAALFIGAGKAARYAVILFVV